MGRYHVRISGPGACETLTRAAAWFYYFMDMCLAFFGWTTLEWSIRNPEHTDKRWLWSDPVHPRATLVEDLLVGWIRQIQRASHRKVCRVVVVGDSTTAHCFDSWYATTTVGGLARRVERRTGLDKYGLWIGSVSGTHFTSRRAPFAEQIRNAVDGGWTYDAVLLVGGWNQLFDPWGFTLRVLRDFNARSFAALR